MTVEVVEPEHTSFKYNPALNELMIGLHHPFFFNRKSQQFELDHNPFGETNLVPMKDVLVSNDFSQLTFEARYRRKQRQFVIAAANAHEKILLELFARFNATGFSTQDDEADRLELHFEKGRLDSIQMYKYSKPAEKLTGSLHIFSEAGQYFLVEARPWRKFPLTSVRVDDNRVISRAADEEFVYTLDVQPVILEAIKRLVDNSVSFP